MAKISNEKLQNAYREFANEIEMIRAEAVQLDVRALSQVLNTRDRITLTKYHMINLIGLWPNGGIELYDQQYGIDQTTVTEIESLGLSQLALKFHSYLVDNNTDLLNAVFENMMDEFVDKLLILVRGNLSN